LIGGTSANGIGRPLFTKAKRINDGQKGVSLSSRKFFAVNADVLAFQLVSQHTSVTSRC
jgi:hypothetical protein